MRHVAAEGYTAPGCAACRILLVRGEIRLTGRGLSFPQYALIFYFIVYFYSLHKCVIINIFVSGFNRAEE